MAKRRLTIVWGKETFWPTRSQGFDVGPFTLEIDIEDDVAFGEAVRTYHKTLADVAQKIFLAKRNAFWERAEASRQ